MKQQLSIRPATIADLPKLVKIYNSAIESRQSTGDLIPFTVEERKEWLAKFDSNSYPIYVGEIEEIVVGYVSLSPYRKGRQAMRKIAEISFYLDNDYLNQGIGSKLTDFMIANCQRIGIEVLIAILLDCNTASVALLEKFGFKKWGHFPPVIDFGNAKYGQMYYGREL
ncbi:MAG: GNAT family N-acetyltransferase [Chitinophagales bacterium]